MQMDKKKGVSGNSIDAVDLLNYALTHDIINLAYIQDEINMNKREKYLKNHPYLIWEGKDGKYRTYLPDEIKGRRLVKRNNRKSIENAIILFYQESEERLQFDFKAMYFKWREVQDQLVGGNTRCKYDTEYIRYFKGSEFEEKIMKDLTEEDIKIFICISIKNKRLNKKAAKTLFGYIRNVVRSARINKVIIDNPMEFLQAKQFYGYCVDDEKSTEEKVVSDVEMKKLYTQFQKDYEKKPEYIPTYAVEFATLTGFRVAEISALRWENITDEYILVDKSEKYDRSTKKYYVDKTKNKKERYFPMTEEIRRLLDRIKKVEIQCGYICEWVFANEGGRIHAPIISSCTKNKCRQIGITEKGIHAYRKTLNSKLRCSGVSAVVAAELLGHSKEVNEQYYTFDITSIRDKANIVSQIDYQTQNIR